MSRITEKINDYLKQHQIEQLTTVVPSGTGVNHKRSKISINKQNCKGDFK